MDSGSNMLEPIYKHLHLIVPLSYRAALVEADEGF
jgi:hypothetical protein